MDIQVLKTFVTLAECRHFTHAAEKLHITQSTVTKRIADLELELEKQLFLRTNKSVSLTNEGEILYNYAIRILELVEESYQKIHSSRKYKEVVRIGAPNFIYDCYLFDSLKESIERDIAIKVVLDHSERLIQMLQDDLLDVVYSFVPYMKKGYVCEVFHEDEFLLVTNYSNTEYEMGISIEMLNQINYLLCNFTVENLGNYIKELFLPFQQFKFEIDNSSKLLNYLITYGGYSFLPRKMVEKYIENKVLRSIPLKDFDAPKVISYKIEKK